MSFGSWCSLPDDCGLCRFVLNREQEAAPGRGKPVQLRKLVKPGKQILKNYLASANDRMLAPDAIATYCLPSIAYVIGEAFIAWLVSKCHRYFPVWASTAAKPPLLSPKKSRPP